MGPGPLWLAGVALCLGASIAGHGLLSAVGAPLVLLRRRPAARVLGMALLAFALGSGAAVLRGPESAPAAVLARGAPECRLEGRVLEHLGGLGTLLGSDLLDCEGAEAVPRAGAVVTERLDAPAGTRMVATGMLVPTGRDVFGQIRSRLGASAVLATREIRTGEVHGLAHRVAAALRVSLRRAAAGLETETGALLRGLAIGDIDGLSVTTSDRLRRAGLTHLVAVSGSNVAIVLGAVMAVAGRSSLRLRLSLAGGALGIFVLVVGPEPSVLRAAAMGSTALLALGAGRRADPVWALAWAVIAVVAFRPGMAGSVGLHLSVAATVGIVLWAGPFMARLSALPGPVAAALSVTLTAQVAVAPVLVLVFGELPLAGLPANLLAAPAVPPATILAFAAGAGGIVLPPLGAFLSALAAPFSDWILLVGRTLGAVSWATVALPPAVAWCGLVCLASLAARAVALPPRR